MTTEHAAQLTACAFAAVPALVLTRRDPRHRPIAWYLCAVFVFDLLRYGLEHVLPAGPAIRTGSALWLRHLGQLAYTGLLVAVPAMTMALFLRWRPWIVVACGAAIWLVTAAAYPALREDDLLFVQWLVELAGGIAAAGMYVMWLRSKEREQALLLSIWCGVLMAAASLATVILPSLAGAKILDHWNVYVLVHAVVFGVVAALQIGHLRRATTKEKVHV